MKHYICLECGETFENPVRIRETHGEPQLREECWCASPCCCGAYREAEYCARCGCTALGLYRRYGLCLPCARETAEQFDRTLRSYSKEQRALLNDLYDGYPLNGDRPIPSHR